MSSILDALKKSDAERQRGLPPTIGSSLPFRRQPPPRKATRWWLLLAAIGAVVLAWAGGLFDFGSGDGDAQDAVPIVADAQSPAQVAVTETPAPATAGSERAPETTAAANVSPAPPGGVGATPPNIASTTSNADSAEPATRSRRIGFGPFPSKPAAETAKEANPPPTSTAANDAAPQAAPTTPQASENRASQTQSPPRATTQPAREMEPDAAKPVTNVDTATTSETSAATTTNSSGIPTLYELPFAARRALPEITVTMHMFSDDPERRFALINGVRVQDGQALDGGVEVVRVLPNGVQVRFESTEFILPVRH